MLLVPHLFFGKAFETSLKKKSRHTKSNLPFFLKETFEMMGAETLMERGGMATLTGQWKKNLF